MPYLINLLVLFSITFLQSALLTFFLIFICTDDRYSIIHIHVNKHTVFRNVPGFLRVDVKDWPDRYTSSNHCTL